MSTTQPTAGAMRAAHTSEITADDLKAERTWLIQHGAHEYMTIGGMSLKAACTRLDREIAELNAEIGKMEGAS